MLAFETTDTWAWTLTVTDPSTASDAYANTATNAKDAAAALVTWANAVGRPWFATGLTFYATWARDGDGGAVLTFGATAPFELDAGAAATLKLAAATYYGSPHKAVGTAAAAGTWHPTVPVSVRGYDRHVTNGDATGDGATRPGSPGRGHYLPSIEAVTSAAEVGRLAAVLADCTTPRIAQVYQTHTADWLSLAIGNVQRQRQGMAYRVTIDAAGVPV